MSEKVVEASGSYYTMDQCFLILEDAQSQLSKHDYFFPRLDVRQPN